MKTLLLIPFIFISGCATMTNNDTTNAQAKTQCPIGYHLEQAPGVVIFSGSNDKNKHTVVFKCVVDSEKDSYKNSLVN